MDILYVIGGVSSNDNLELRMSLRSIIKYGSNIGKVAVVGKPPSWLASEVATLEVEDRYTYKHSNILMCIEKAIDAKIVSGDFLYSSDDHFYCRNVDFAQYPFFYKGDLRNYVLPTDPFYRYHKSLYDTRQLCLKHNLPTTNYSQHCNTHMHSAVISEIRGIIHESYHLPFGVEPTSIIMNAWQTHEKPPKTKQRKDLKIVRCTSLADLWMQIGDRDCFSISDSASRNPIIKHFFAEEYSQKSCFEK